MKHLTEFWGSFLASSLAFEFIRRGQPTSTALLMIIWLWCLRTIILILGDLSKMVLIHRWYLLVVISGALASLLMSTMGYSFRMFTLPLCYALGLVGLYATYNAYTHTNSSERSPLLMSCYLLFSLFFITRLLFPVWHSDKNLILIGYGLEILFLVGFSGTGLSSILCIFRTRDKASLHQLLKERSEKFLGQNKFCELGMVSAGIAHEINNPLAVIQARTTQLLRIFRNAEKQSELAEGLEQILYTSERINRTIQGVREYIHQDNNSSMKEISLQDLFNDVLVFCGQRMKNHGINLRFYGLEKFKVIGNKIQLEQVILNLFNNSFDAIEFLSDKWIEVSCHETDDMIELLFKDSGSGIPREIASRMMEPFFSTKEIGKGTGLGLSLARGIIVKHGGSLDYLSNSSHTTFSLKLPKLFSVGPELPHYEEQPLH